MARKQNKSVKTTKKDSSTRINTKNGGKVQKKLQESKTKKKTESQVKQALKTQGKQNKNQAKVIPSSAITGKRSSRGNLDKAKMTSTSSSQGAKISSPTKPSSFPQTKKVQSASKRKSNPIEQTESKKRASITNAQKSIKTTTSPANQKQVGNKMSLRGKKRSYAQLASGNKSEETNSPKKKKTEESIDMTSRGTRNIKPTVKGSEWRNTILQKKSTFTQQEKTSGKVGKTLPKNRSPVTAKKSPRQSKITSPPKLAKTPKTPTTKGKTVAKSPKRQSKGKISTKEIKQPSPSKNKAKKPEITKAAVSKSPKGRSQSRKSTSNQSDSSEQNTLATSIRKTFRSSVTNKRKSKGSNLEENELVAQGILNDILSSVGSPDILTNDKGLEDDINNFFTSGTPSKVDKNEDGKNEQDTDVLPGTTNSAVSESANEDCKNEQADDLPETANSTVSETKEQSSTIGHESVKTSDHIDSESKSELNSDSNANSDLKMNESVDLGTQPNIEDADKKNENDTVEDIELHLSDTSAMSLNLTSENISPVEASSGTVNESKPNENDMNDTVSHPANICNSKQTKEDDKLSESSKNEPMTLVNGNISVEDATGDTSLSGKPKVSSQTPTKEEVSSLHDTFEGKLSGKVILPPSLAEVPPKTSESVLENSNGSTALNDVITIHKEEVIEPSNQTNHQEPELSDIKMKFKKSDNDPEELSGENDSQLGLSEKIDKVKNCIDNEIESIKKSNIDEHDISLSNGTSTISDLKSKTTSKKDDSSTISSPYSSPNKPQNRPSSGTNIDQKELKQDNLMINGNTSISPDVLLKENDDSVQKSSLLSEELTSAENKSIFEISNAEKELKVSHVVGNVTSDIHDTNTCEQKNELKLKESENLRSFTDLNPENAKECLKKENVNTEETIHPRNEETKELKTEELVADKDKVSQILPLDFEKSPNHIEENELSCDPKKISSDCSTVLERETLSSEDKIQDVLKAEQGDQKIPTETPKDDGPANQVNDAEEFDLNSGSSDETGQDNKVAVESISSSSHVEPIPSDEKCSVGSNQENEKTEILHDSTGDVASHSDSKLPLQILPENIDISQPSEEVSISNAEREEDASESIEPAEECLKMEEVNQEVIQDTMSVNDTDGESMQCSSGTHSNRMSVDEDNPGMDVDSEDIVATVSACSTIEIMEVS